jgi:hypothetical protein
MRKALVLALLVCSAFAADKPHKLTSDAAKAAPQAQVILHPRTNIYHCASIKTPFTVKDGKPMTQAEALKLGARPMRGMYCLEGK